MKQLALTISTSLLLLFGTIACSHESNNQQDHVSVVGVGMIEHEPDQVILNVSIKTLQPSLAAAKDLADKYYRSVLAVIEAANIDKKYIKVTRINAQPEYVWTNNKQVYKGERVSRSLSIIINDLDKVSSLMQALVKNGVSTIDGMTAGFQDSKGLQLQALEAAADDAATKAKFLAERLGRNLGDAYSITEHNNDSPQIFRGERMMMKPSIQEAAPAEMFGTQKITATVNVSFNLL